MTKRDFLKALATGAVGVFAGPAFAWADPARILGSRRLSHDLGAAREASPELKRLMTQVRVGQVRTHGALSVFWLHGPDAEPRLPISTFDEARTGGALVIQERKEATVDTLVAENRGKTYVLLLAGEIVLGGKQNRVIADDVLLPPRSGPLDIAVYCVEQGRWVERGSKEFGAAGSFAAPALRARVVEPGAQGKVWAEVSRYAAGTRAQSPTGSYQSIYDRPEVSAHQREVAHAIEDPPAGALGAAVFVDERLTGLDLFQGADLFRREWGKLLGAQALETYGRRDEPTPTAPKLRARTESLVRLAATAEGTFRQSVGAGALFEFRVPGLRGTALVAEARVIHAALL